ncbi:hypothetical protein LINPERPRIM_LOCUS21014 [Linum perenne]
MLFLEVSYKS